MPHSCIGAFPRKESGIQVLAGITPNSQTIGEAPGHQSKPEKNQQKVIQKFQLNGNFLARNGFDIFMVQ
jgi:hypothetical protein